MKAIKRWGLDWIKSCPCIGGAEGSQPPLQGWPSSSKSVPGGSQSPPRDWSSNSKSAAGNGSPFHSFPEEEVPQDLLVAGQNGRKIKVGPSPQKSFQGALVIKVKSISNLQYRGWTMDLHKKLQVRATSCHMRIPGFSPSTRSMRSPVLLSVLAVVSLRCQPISGLCLKG